jgi:hypothetical protein
MLKETRWRVGGEWDWLNLESKGGTLLLAVSNLQVLELSLNSRLLYERFSNWVSGNPEFERLSVEELL